MNHHLLLHHIQGVFCSQHLNSKKNAHGIFCQLIYFSPRTNDLKYFCLTRCVFDPLKFFPSYNNHKRLLNLNQKQVGLYFVISSNQGNQPGTCPPAVLRLRTLLPPLPPLSVVSTSSEQKGSSLQSMPTKKTCHILQIIYLLIILAQHWFTKVEINEM